MAEGSEQDDKTEDPTQRRLDEAMKRGDVAKSQEVSTFLALGALTLSLPLAAAAGIGSALVLDLRGFLMNAHLVPDAGSALLGAGRRGVLAGLWLLAIPVGLLTLAALAGGLIQHRPLWTVDPLMPKFERVSPLAGLKRVFGQQAMVQFLKGLLKLALVGAIAGAILMAERDRLESFVGLGPAPLAAALLTLALKLLGAVLAVFAVVTIADVVYQRFSWMKRQRMSREELKQEMKEQDGHPEVKAKLRQIRAQRLRKRMMAGVPTATVVLANPTHYAVALRYETGMAAPICVAKGVDGLAQRIKEVAAEHGVAVIENPPLARALHAAVEIDAESPVEHYTAVAEVIGFVLRLKRRAS
jgi:flagellar biosynthetic protein FlhB